MLSHGRPLGRTDPVRRALAVASERLRARRLLIRALLALCAIASATPTGALAASGKPRAFAVQATPSFKVLVPGQAVVITGRVEPSAAGQKVQLQLAIRGRWRTISVRALSAKSEFRFGHSWRTLGAYRLRVLKAGAGQTGRGASRPFSVNVARRVTARSTGRAVHVSLGAVSVSAPAGAIRAGQTLTVSAGGSSGAREGAPSIAGGPHPVSTSQGEPRAPVKVSFAYDPSLLAKGERPLFLHGLSSPSWWMPQATTLDGAHHLASATLDSFSLMDLVGDGAYYGGLITGNRADAPSPCAQTPSWLHGMLAADKREAVMACFGTESNSSQVVLHLVNNRGYAQMLQVSGALKAHFKPSWWSDTLESQAEVALAAATPTNGPHTFILSPGGSVTISFEKPASQPAAQYVYIAGVPRVAGAVAELAWSLLSTAKAHIGLPTDVLDCVSSAVYRAFSGDRGQVSAIDEIHHCAAADVGLFASKAAQDAFQKLAYGLVVADFFYKLIDIEDGEAFPPQISFDIPGTNPTFTNPSIHLGAGSFGTLPAGQQTIEHLSAGGGTPPYTYHFYNLNPVPSWVTLAPDGTLTINPPVGDLHAYSFYAYATDATNQHSPFARDTVSFQTNGAGGGGGPYLTSVSCASPTFCVAVGSHGKAMSFNGSSWSSPTSIDISGNYLASVSCPSSFFCAAVDYAGNVFTFNGSSWSLPTHISVPDYGLVSVSCPSSSFCVADNSTDMVSFNGSSWNAPVYVSFYSFDSVSCPSASFCTAVNGGSSVSTFNGSSWSSLTSAGSSGGGVTAVSCSSPTFCMLVDRLAGDAVSFNGSSWSSPTVIDATGNVLSSVSCASWSFCAAVDGNGKAMTFNGSSWSSPINVDAVGALNSVSCPTASFCVAVDSGGNAVEFNGISWSSPITINN